MQHVWPARNLRVLRAESCHSTASPLDERCIQVSLFLNYFCLVNEPDALFVTYVLRYLWCLVRNNFVVVLLQSDWTAKTSYLWSHFNLVPRFVIRQVQLASHLELHPFSRPFFHRRFRWCAFVVATHSGTSQLPTLLGHLRPLPTVPSRSVEMKEKDPLHL